MSTASFETCIVAPTPIDPGLPAAEVHARLRAALDALQAAQRNAVLWFAEVLNRHLFHELGYPSIHAYAAAGLGFSATRTAQYMRLCRSLEALPAVKRAVAAGELPWTKARVVAQVATPETEAFWVEQARSTGRRELERRAAEARRRTRLGIQRAVRESDSPTGAPGDSPAAPSTSDVVETPLDVTFRMSPEQYARYEALLVRARKRGARGSREEVLLAALEQLAEGPAVGGDGAAGTRVHVPGPRYQVIITQCPDCGQASTQTSRGPKPISLATLEAILCDARIQRPGERNRSTIPPSMRRLVMARDHYRCRGAGCGSANFLDVHHVIPRAAGGGNDIDNLITLCSHCHQFTHDQAGRTDW